MDKTPGFPLRAGAVAAALLALLAGGPSSAATAAPAARTAPAAPDDGRHAHRAGQRPAVHAVRPPAGPGLHVPAGRAARTLPQDLSARSWMVSDARTGQVLAAKDAHRRLPPASTLKMLFALTLLPRFPQDSLRTVRDEDLRAVGAGSSMVGLKPGHRYTVADLWRGVFLASGNDAVHVLAAMNGSVERTVRQMRARARMLGATDTRVVSPDGYDAPGQVSSAYDLSLFARAGLAQPYFARYCGLARTHFPTGRDAAGRQLGGYAVANTNRLLSGGPGVTPYPGAVGVKNGYTTHAGNTLAAAARRDGRTLLVTVMNPTSGAPHAVYQEARALLDWGFSVAGDAPSVGTLNPVRPGDPLPAPPPGVNSAGTTVTPEPDGDGAGRPAAYTGAVVLLGAALAWALRPALRRRRARWAATAPGGAGTGAEDRGPAGAADGSGGAPPGRWDALRSWRGLRRRGGRPHR
ncbi:D-alanyl-D-alanine carboxypeptidase family protein [Streptomyces zingiberis]|uniref:D-alanyl-D-alanine carboxypeptidase n=1 Tax=Streptomyces zingiberis TaxID=2053010 RepID=A0ABX1BUK6_9ACTN|nr:serine hydrolase [Streptomyces zingiberis]NJQ00230.1 D-alanyl-D-alanine carboxypeptidase [Streptomyces zingiberis]